MYFPDCELFVLNTDAQSRIAIYMINHANSPLIAQLGNLSHDEFRGGFISGDGRMTVSGDASCVHQIMSDSPAFFSASVPSPMGYDLTVSNEKIMSITPEDMTTLLSNMTGMCDFISLCRNLGLDKEDFDHLENGIFIRSFGEEMIEKNPVPLGCFLLPIRDHLGCFERMNVLYGDVVFELKLFKFVNLNGMHVFYFKPEHSGVWFRDGVPAFGEVIILDTDIPDVWYRLSPANAGLIDVGDNSEIDWKLFSGHETQYVWRSNTLQCKNDLSKALCFLADARKNDVEVVILKYNSISQESEVVKLPEVIIQARCYGLDIPAALKDTGCIHVSAPQDEFIPDDIPFFWSRGGSTLFFNLGYKVILKKLLNAFCRVSPDTQNVVKSIPNCDMSGTRSGFFPQKQVGIFYPASAESRTNKLMRKTDHVVPRISSVILQKKDALESALYLYKIKILFIVYADELPVKELTSVLELCERIRIVTGVFSPVAAENKPVPEDVLKGSTMELVAQYYLVTVDGDSLIAKDMTTEITERYTFERDGRVSVSEWNDTNTMENEEEN